MKKTDKAAEKPVEETVKPVRHQETKKEQPKPREEKKIIKRSEEEIAEIKAERPAAPEIVFLMIILSQISQ